MKHRVIYCVLTVLLAVLFTSGHAAHAGTKTQFQKYVFHRAYVTKLKNLASDYALSKEEDCTSRNTIFERKRFDILQQPAFNNKSVHPSEGIWIEKVSVFVCGTAHFLDITVVGNKNGKIPKFDVSESKQPRSDKPKKKPHIYGDYDF